MTKLDRAAQNLKQFKTLAHACPQLFLCIFVMVAQPNCYLELTTANSLFLAKEDKQCYRKRQVSCVDLDGNPLDPGDCLSNSKPSALETCSCSARCEDHKDTGVWRLGSHLSCWQLQSFCEDETMGKHVRSTCPVTCKLCATTNILLPGCDDMYPTSLIINESSMEDLTCTQLSQRGACKKLDVARRCPKSCGHCPSAAVTCADDKEFRDANNRRCTTWLGFVCSENISRACPASCGFCT